MDRISVAKSVALLVLSLLFAPYCLAGDSVEKRVKVIFDNPSYDFQLQRTLGVTLSGGADINECLSTGRKIIEGDDESWYTHWRALADRVYLMGERALAAGHSISAREAFQRACNYYRTCEFFLHGNPKDPRIMESWRLSRDSFQKAAKLMEHPIEVIKIPYEETTLPGYFLRPDESVKPRKTLIIQTGFDGTAEELYFTRAFFALKRGYNVLLFEGPGQGGALREQHLFFRTDWENVVTPVVDYALSRKEVDPDRLALMGISMGGYLVPRAAAFEHRLAAIIANPGSGDLYVQDRAQLPGLRSHPDESNEYLRQAMDKSMGFRWFINNGMFATDTASPVEFLLFWSQYELGELATKIKTNTLCVVSKEDHVVDYKRLQQFYDDLQCSKTLLLFTREEAASDHCQMGALAVSSSRIYDWLDDVLSQ
jgi:cephalosporin-C deacetylase-like acetyl esterase